MNRNEKLKSILKNLC